MHAWDLFLEEQERQLGAPVVNKWLRPLKVVSFDACNLYLESDDAFKVLWFEEHIRPQVQKSLLNNNRKPIKLHLKVASKRPPEREEPSKAGAAPPFTLHFEPIHSSFELRTFLTDSGNLLAYRLLEEASDHLIKGEPPAFNPIYLFGRSGTGKSHLLQGMAKRLKEKGLRVLYASFATFTEHVVEAIRTGQMQVFRSCYRLVDALVLDDVEILARKGATQEELFHTFNALHTANKQIVLSSSLPPSALKFIEPRLISRFEWGIVAPLQMLSQEKRGEVLTQRAQKAEFPLKEEVKEFLLTAFSSNLKQLIRALEALILRSHLNQGVSSSSLPLSLPAVKHLLADLVLEEERQLLTPTKIIQTVAEHYGIKSEDILSKSQSRDCVLPRQIAIYLCRQRLHLAYMKIGELFERDHSTIMASVKVIKKGLETKNQEIFNSLQTLLARLEN